MLALYTVRDVAPEVNLWECISCTPLQSSKKAEPTPALKPRGTVNRSPKQGYQWPHKWTYAQQNFQIDMDREWTLGSHEPSAIDAPSELSESLANRIYHKPLQITV